MCCTPPGRCSAPAASKPLPGGLDERAFRRAVFHGYPDRAGRRRQRDSPRILLVLGPRRSPGGGERRPRWGSSWSRSTCRPAGAARAPKQRSEWRVSSSASGWSPRTPRGSTSSIANRGVSARSGASTTARSCSRTRRSHSIRQRLPPSVREAYAARGWSDADDQLARRLRFAFDGPRDACAPGARLAGQNRFG